MLSAPQRPARHSNWFIRRRRKHHETGRRHIIAAGIITKLAASAIAVLDFRVPANSLFEASFKPWSSSPSSWSSKSQGLGDEDADERRTETYYCSRRWCSRVGIGVGQGEDELLHSGRRRD
ncbi:cytochrome P450 [Striga asiatica]|uniref:Cytochrome P450 n=1 Tax=Striga asiatica TaxID=4170 RepID=A0A5A7NW29_STRAF|nr:cytochrome P450 [Striga asiatica]